MSFHVKRPDIALAAAIGASIAIGIHQPSTVLFLIPADAQVVAYITKWVTP